MALEKVEYTDGKTPITAKNLNDIQDEIIENQKAIAELKTQGTGTAIVNAVVE